jgi:hypothetical protein
MCQTTGSCRGGLAQRQRLWKVTRGSKDSASSGGVSSETTVVADGSGRSQAAGNHTEMSFARRSPGSTPERSRTGGEAHGPLFSSTEGLGKGFISSYLLQRKPPEKVARNYEKLELRASRPVDPRSSGFTLAFWRLPARDAVPFGIASRPSRALTPRRSVCLASSHVGSRFYNLTLAHSLSCGNLPCPQDKKGLGNRRQGGGRGQRAIGLWLRRRPLGLPLQILNEHPHCVFIWVARNRARLLIRLFRLTA